MKTILTSIILLIGFNQFCSAGRFTTVPMYPIVNSTESYNYSFKVEGIDNYGYKSFIDYVEEIFGKRPVYNAATGKFHNDNNEFIIQSSSVQISETDLRNKLSIVGISLTVFNGSTVTESNNEQPK